MCGEAEFGIHFILALLQEQIRFAKPLLDTFLRADVGHDKQHVLLLVRPLNNPAAKDRWDFSAVFPGQVETRLRRRPLTVTRFVLLFDIGKVFAGENSIGRATLNLVALRSVPIRVSASFAKITRS